MIEMTSLGQEVGLQVIRKWAEQAKRKFTQQQQETIAKALAVCSLPLYARIAFDHVIRWKSYDVTSSEAFAATVQGAISQLFASIEEKFGDVIVRHCLAYLSASRSGVTEAELEHLLSIDDAFLNAVFKLWMPPVRRAPRPRWRRCDALGPRDRAARGSRRAFRSAG